MGPCIGWFSRFRADGPRPGSFRQRRLIFNFFFIVALYPHHDLWKATLPTWSSGGGRGTEALEVPGA
eukprot:1481900-Pleurochrysis_carterae.AAC.1